MTAVVAAAVLLPIAAYCLWCAYGPVNDVALNTPIRHDDFLFSVQNVSSRRSGRLMQYTAAILVQNQARRLGYPWRDSIAYLADASGTRYRPSSKGSFWLAPGESRVAHVAFNVPADSTGVVLRFWDGVFIGDAFDANAYGRTAVRIPE